MIINVHDKDLNIIGVIDNSIQNAVHYDDDKLTEDLPTGTAVYEFTAYKNLSAQYETTSKNPFDSLTVGNWVSFKHGEKEYLLKIVETERKSDEVYVYCEDLVLELRNENAGEYSTEEEKTIEEYIKEMKLIAYAGMSVRLNEAGKLKKALSFTETETKLSRMLSLFKEFGVEHKFTLKLKPNGRVRDFYVDIFLPRDAVTGDGGVGSFKSDKILREGEDIKTVAEKQNILEVWNRTRPVGKSTVTRIEVKGAKTATVAKESVVVSGNMVNANGTLSIENIQTILKLCYEYRVLPSGVISQLYLESFWGNSNVARVDNNWSGMTWTGNPNRPSGVVVSQGSARPSNEGGYYMHFANMSDFFKDYFYLLAKQGIYNVANKDNISDYTRGLFRVGGAQYDYAAAGYDHYNSLMAGIRNGINKNNSNVLDTYDDQWRNPNVVTSTTVEIASANKTKSALNELSGLVGRTVGNGQCYAVPAWLSYKLGGAGLGCGLGGFSGLVGSGVRACDIGTDYAWSNFGWGLKVSGFSAGDILSGSIINIRANYGAPWYTGYYGHTIVVESVSGDTMTIIQQNYAGKQYLTRDNYSISQILPSIQSIVYTPELTSGGRVEGGNKVVQENVTQRYVNVDLPTEVNTTEETLDIYISQDTFKEYFDDNGVLEFRVRDGYLDAVQSVSMYPSQFASNEGGDQWIRRDFEYQVSSEEELIEKALADLKKHCYPQIDFEVEGYFDGEIGDTFLIESPKFTPQLNIKARIISKETSFTRPENSKTTFSNYIKLKSQVSDFLQQRFESILESKIPYEIRVTASNGTSFKNNEGESELTVESLKSGITQKAEFFFKNGDSIIGKGEKLLVKATDFENVLNLTIEAYVNNSLVATKPLTFTDVEDGAKGEPGAPGADGKTSYLHIAYASSADGKTGFSFTDTKQQYQGYYTDFTQANSTDPTKYTWMDRRAGVEVGGVNLIKQSTVTKGFRLGIDKNPFADQAHSMSDWIEVEQNTTYTLTTYEDVTETNMWYSLAWYSTNSADYSGFISLPTGALSATDLKGGKQYTSPSNATYAKISYPTNYPKVKFERGNIATDYSQALEDTQEQIDSKADGALTQDQLNALTEKNNLIKAEMEAKASIDTVNQWITAYQNYVKANDEDKTKSEQALQDASARLLQLNTDIGALKQQWNFIDTYMSIQNEGLIIGKSDGSAYAKFSDDRISLFSGSSEVMYISQGTLNIANGIFTKTIQIGRFRFETHPADADMLVVRFLGG